MMERGQDLAHRTRKSIGSESGVLGSTATPRPSTFSNHIQLELSASRLGWSLFHTSAPHVVAGGEAEGIRVACWVSFVRHVERFAMLHSRPSLGPHHWDLIGLNVSPGGVRVTHAFP